MYDSFSHTHIQTIQSLQPQQVAGVGGMTREERVTEILDDILEKLRENFDMLGTCCLSVGFFLGYLTFFFYSVFLSLSLFSAFVSPLTLLHCRHVQPRGGAHAIRQRVSAGV